MKKFLIGFLVSFVLVSFGVTLNSNAACPAGYTASPTVLFTGSDGCQWDISFCYKCGIAGASATNVFIDDIKPHTIPPPSGCIIPDKNEITNFMLTLINSYCTVPSCGNPPVNCATKLTVVINYPVCWHWVRNGYNDGSYHFSQWLEPCTSGYCQVTYIACIDPTTSLIVRCQGSAVTYVEHDVTCQTTPIAEPQLPSPPSSGDLGIKIVSDCYKAVTDCQ